MTEKENLQRMLTQCNEAIMAITMGGQSYTIGDRTLTRANLTEVRNMRLQLMQELANLDASEGRITGACVGIFDGR